MRHLLFINLWSSLKLFNPIVAAGIQVQTTEVNVANADSIKKLLEKVMGKAPSASRVGSNAELKLQFESGSEQWNDKLAKVQPFSEFAHLPGLRWLMGKHWQHRYAYGCGCCWNYVMSTAYASDSAQNSELRSARKSYALFGLDSPVNLSHAIRHSMSPLHRHAVAYHYSVNLTNVALLKQPSANDFNAAPPVKDWISLWEHVTGFASGRQFAKSLEREAFKTDPQYAGAGVHGKIFFQMRFCAAEHYRCIWRQCWRDAGDLGIHWDGQWQFEIVTFNSTSRRSMETTDGLLGVADAFNLTVVGKSREDTLDQVQKAERCALALSEEIRHFGSPGRQVDVASWKMDTRCDEHFVKSCSAKISHGTSDRANEALLVGKLLKQKGITPEMASLTDDISHEMKTSLKGPARNHPKVSLLWWHLFGKKSAPGKRLRYSIKAITGLDAAEDVILSEVSSQAAGRLQGKLRNFSYAPQRFDQESNPYEGIILVFLAFIKRVCTDSQQLTDAEDREAMADTARFLDRENVLTMAMYTLYQKHTNHVLDHFQADHQDAALISESVRQLHKDGLRLFGDAAVFDGSSKNTLVNIMLETMRQSEGLNFGKDEVTTFSWSGPEPNSTLEDVPWAKAALDTMQEVVSLTNSLLEVGFLNHDSIENLFLAFQSECVGGKDAQG